MAAAGTAYAQDMEPLLAAMGYQRPSQQNIGTAVGRRLVDVGYVYVVCVFMYVYNIYIYMYKFSNLT